jgi:hypothetical protein
VEQRARGGGPGVLSAGGELSTDYKEGAKLVSSLVLEFVSRKTIETDGGEGKRVRSWEGEKGRSS